MLNFLKQIGKGTTYEFCKNAYFTPLPNKNNKGIIASKTIIDNEWYDKMGIRYRLFDDVLYIITKDYFPNEGYSIIDYINEIPEHFGLTIILKIKSKQNEVSGFNMLCNLFATQSTRQKIVIDITEMEFCEKVSLNIEDLPNNVKLSSQFDHTFNENYIFSNQSFESWAMNCNEENFKLLVSKLTYQSRARIVKMREICRNFYEFASKDIKNASSMQKAMFAYNWCCQNIKYDVSATNSDGTLKYDRRDSQDPVHTFDHRTGVCEGRARLFKLLLNNYYMKVPCFLVKGMSGRLQHTWNEVLLEDSDIIDLDISKQSNRIAHNHSELLAFNSISLFNFSAKM